jgi:hypothetical protein
MIKLAVIIGGALLMAGVAFAGTRTLLEQTSGPTIDTPLLSPAANTTIRQEDRGLENEVRGRENEPGEDVRGPCDELEHTTDPQCTGAAVEPGADDDVADDRGNDNRGDDNGGPGPNAGPSNRSGQEGGDDSSDHGGGDDGDHSGHGGGGDDD